MKSKAKFIEVNPISDNGLRWIENIGTAWRFTGFADEICRIDHRGWFTDDFQSEVMRGVVYQLPSRKGENVFFVGYSDPYNDDCAFGRIEIGIDKNDAAHMADDIAKRCAETEREYQAAWQLGREFADTGETIETERETRKKLFAELRTLKTVMPENADTPTICAVIQAKIKSTRRNIRAAYDRQREIVRESYISPSVIDAFTDGANITSAEAARLFA